MVECCRVVVRLLLNSLIFLLAPFAVSEIVRMFAVLQVDELNHPAGQAVNLLNCLLGIFYVQNFAGDINVGSKVHIRYWRLPIRKLRLAFRGEVHQLVAAYMAAAFLLPIL